MGGTSFERFALLSGALVTASAAAGEAAPGPLVDGADVVADADGCRCCKLAGNGAEGVRLVVSVGRLSVATAGGAICVVAGVSRTAGCRFAVAGAGDAMLGSTILGSFGLAGEMLSGVGDPWSAKLGRAALCNSACPCDSVRSLVSGCVGKTAGEMATGAVGNGRESITAGGKAAGGEFSPVKFSISAGESHAAGRHSQQQQHRRLRSLQAAAGSTSSKHTEIQTSAACPIFRSRFITSSLPGCLGTIAKPATPYHLDRLRLESGRVRRHSPPTADGMVTAAYAENSGWKVAGKFFGVGKQHPKAATSGRGLQISGWQHDQYHNDP